MNYSYQTIIKSSGLMTLISLVGIALSTVACNTMEGVGTDIKMTGKALEESAERHKEPSKQTSTQTSKPKPVPACYPNCPKHH